MCCLQSQQNQHCAPSSAHVGRQELCRIYGFAGVASASCSALCSAMNARTTPSISARSIYNFSWAVQNPMLRDFRLMHWIQQPLFDIMIIIRKNPQENPRQKRHHQTQREHPWQMRKLWQQHRPHCFVLPYRRRARRQSHLRQHLHVAAREFELYPATTQLDLSFLFLFVLIGWLSFLFLLSAIHVCGIPLIVNECSWIMRALERGNCKSSTATSSHAPLNMS